MKWIIFPFILIIFTSCGSLTLNPTGCRSNGVWGRTPKNSEAEIKLSEVYYVWTSDYEVRLRDFLQKEKIDCMDVKKIRIEMDSVFFVKRELKVFVLK